MLHQQIGWQGMVTLADGMIAILQLRRCSDMRSLPQAMLLINDLELVDSPDHFETRLKAGGVLDVAELYPWTGEEV